MLPRSSCRFSYLQHGSSSCSSTPITCLAVRRRSPIQAACLDLHSSRKWSSRCPSSSTCMPGVRQLVPGRAAAAAVRAHASAVPHKQPQQQPAASLGCCQALHCSSSLSNKLLLRHKASCTYPQRQQQLACAAVQSNSTATDTEESSLAAAATASATAITNGSSTIANGGVTGSHASSSSSSSSSSNASTSRSGSYDTSDTSISALIAESEASAGEAAGTSARLSADTAVLSCEDIGLSPSDSADDLCAINEMDTPEGLTDMNYTAPANPIQERRFRTSYTPGTWQEEEEDPFVNWWKNRDDLITLAYAVAMGGVVATSVFIFDVSIQYVHDLPDILAQLHVGGGRATGLVVGDTAIPFRCIMPIGAGLIVAYLQSWGFSPALKFLTRAIEGVVDDSKNAALPTSYWQVFRRAAASVITLGSGASLGPEAPSVELGANTAAVFAPKHLSKRRQRMLVAAGAAAGVSAAFDAPATGALFAIEFVLKSSRLGLDRLSTSTVFASTSVAAGVIGFLRSQGQALGITGAATHLVGRIPYFSINPNLLTDVLQFSVLGVGCAGAAVLLYEGVRVSEVVLRPLPRWVSAPLGGAVCGLIAFKFPQVQYGYINLEEIFRDSTRLSAVDLSSLLMAKIAATSVCVGGGLVGGLFAPSLFIGALVGDIMGHFVANRWGMADPTTLVVVGAAAVLGAACRAPLTAFGLMVEITRDTGLFVPLLAAVGVASLVSEYAEGIFSEKLETALTSLYLKEKLLFWGASSADASTPATAAAGIEAGDGDSAANAIGTRSGATNGALGGLGGAVAVAVKPQQKTVEAVIATPARLYVRHTLPLEQAKDALVARASAAAVVVDDSFTPLGIVYLDDIEAELVKQKLLTEPDNNFDRPVR